MRRTTRLFELIQLLRRADRPLTAGAIAERLEVSARTVYRDVVSLQGAGVPVHGEAGIGYVMRTGYDLPPLMLSVDEVEALVVALGLVERTGDRGLKQAAASIRDKVATILPGPARRPLEDHSLRTSAWGTAEPDQVDMGMLRQAIRQERKLALTYRDEHGQASERTVWPIAVVYYVEVIVLVAWCELRRAVRHFRADRILACSLGPDDFAGQGDRLRRAWYGERMTLATAP